MFKYILSALLVLSAVQTVHADFDYTDYARFLNTYVKQGRTIGGVKLNCVDYEAVKRDTSDITTAYPRLLAELAAFDPERLKTRGQKVAFWINAYNIGAIKLVIDDYPVESIRSVRINLLTTPWRMKTLSVGGKKYSLDEIEHAILIKRLGEPRAHFAVVCASVSCPDLSVRPYRAETLDAQLDGAARAFINNETKGVRIDRADKTLYISKVFDWGEKDFKKIGGVPAVIERYLADPEDLEFMKAGQNWVNFMTYDWKQVARSRYTVKAIDYSWKLNDAKF